MLSDSNWILGPVGNDDGPHASIANHFDYTAEECEALANTDKAVLVRGPDVPGGKAWIPYYAIADDSEVRVRGDRGSVLIKHHFAADHGWLDWLRDPE